MIILICSEVTTKSTFDWKLIFFPKFGATINNAMLNILIYVSWNNLAHLWTVLLEVELLCSAVDYGNDSLW